MNVMSQRPGTDDDTHLAPKTKWPRGPAQCWLVAATFFPACLAPKGTMKLLALAAMTASATADCMATAPSVASHFSVEMHDSYKVVRSTQAGCNNAYILYHRGTEKPNLGSEYKYFATPLQRVALTQTVSNTFLEILGVSSAAAVISSYTTSACLHKRVEDGLAVEYVGPSNPWGGGNDTEHAMQMQSVDAVFTDPFGASGFEAGDFGAKTICVAETYETEQLSQAEWIKFYGLFFEKETEAATAMCGTASRFACSSIAANAASLSQGTTYQPPKAAFVSKDYTGNLKINTVPKAMALLRHAGAVFPDMSAYASRRVMHFSGDYEEGYRFDASAVDEFHEVLAMFDVVIDESYPYMQTQESIATAYGIPEGVAIPAFVSGRVYTLDKTMSHNGLASDIYESAIAEPDGYLADLIAVIHAGGLSSAEAASTTSFVRHAASGSVMLATSETCANPVSVRAARSPVCADTAGQLTLITSVGVIEDTCQPVTSITYPQCPSLIDEDGEEEQGGWALFGGAIAGISVGGAVLIAILIAITIWCCVKTNKASGAENAVAKV